MTGSPHRGVDDSCCSNVAAGVAIGCLGREDVVLNKKAAGRPKDLADLELLEAEDDDSAE